MEGDADIAKIGALVADPARARILLALGDGRTLPATALADEAGVSASTASAHLGKLVAGGMLEVERDGRHRYFRVAGPAVAELIEALARLSPPSSVHPLHKGTKPQAVRFARTCYDHLAGSLGTSLMDAMLKRELLAAGPGHMLTPRGADELTGFGIDLPSLRERRRPLVRHCVDWSEQRHHLAGALGAAVAERMFELGWVKRSPNGRAVLVTDDGYRGLRQTFGVELGPR
ncbi:MAG TPA: winged helix-turn-helix domain-containing protein [Solirubrobacteraceae bacterium]|nr:winged helix-turn-helix domain-containing protein [Solirubrobacteraceae bacterium]